MTNDTPLPETKGGYTPLLKAFIALHVVVNAADDKLKAITDAIKENKSTKIVDDLYQKDLQILQIMNNLLAIMEKTPKRELRSACNSIRRDDVYNRNTEEGFVLPKTLQDCEEKQKLEDFLTQRRIPLKKLRIHMRDCILGGRALTTGFLMMHNNNAANSY